MPMCQGEHFDGGHFEHILWTHCIYHVVATYQLLYEETNLRDMQ